jgi:apolipoprotein N-acyltransferase
VKDVPSCARWFTPSFAASRHRAVVLICYEKLLVWPILQSALEHPTIVLGIANDYWCRGTRVPVNQQACLRAWARLFGLPMVAAVNQ